MKPNLVFLLLVGLSKVETSEVKINSGRHRELKTTKTVMRKTLLLYREIRGFFYNICHAFAMAHKICHIHVVYLI